MEQFNAAAAAVAPETGMPTFATVSVPTDSDAPGEATAPNTGYPLYGSYEYAWNSHGILVQGLGVCASYAYAFNALANAAGVETVVATGEIAASASGHAWNKVNIDGQWLAVDPTWNDSSVPNQFLMISDSQFTDTALRSEDRDWMVDLEIAAFATP